MNFQEIIDNNQELQDFFKEFDNPKDLEEFLVYSKNLYNYFRRKPDKEELISLLSDIVSKENKDLENNISHLVSNENNVLGNSLLNSLSSNSIQSKNEINSLLNYNKLELTGNIKETIQSEFNESITLRTIQEKIDTLSESFRSNPSRKGEYSQHKFIESLYSEFPEHEVIDTSDQTAMCDFNLKKSEKPDILIELKNYNSPVPKREVEKFHRDTIQNSVCGILVSISSGISNKKDFSFEIIDNCVLFYLHNNGFNCSRLRFTVNVIYKVKEILSTKESNEKIEITKGMLENLKSEYSAFEMFKENIVSKLKEMIKDISKVEIKSLDKLLKNRVEVSDTQTKLEVKKNWCEDCQRSYSSKTALTKHRLSKH